MARKMKLHWNVTAGLESYMVEAIEHLERYRKLSLLPSTKTIKQIMPGSGIPVEYDLREGVCCIRISAPKPNITTRIAEPYFEALPPMALGESGNMTEFIEVSLMRCSPADNCRYSLLSIINRTDPNGWPIPAKFSIQPGHDSHGWSLVEGKEQPDGSYKVDGRSATLRLAPDATGSCELAVDDGEVRLEKIFKIEASRE